MNRPTREQIEAARAWLTNALPGAAVLLGVAGEELLRAILAASAEPTEAALRKEAAAYLEQHEINSDLDIYIAGARREGAR